MASLDNTFDSTSGGFCAFMTRTSIWSSKGLEESLLPVQEEMSTIKKVLIYTKQFFQALFYAPIAGISSLFTTKREETPLEIFSRDPKWDSNDIKPPVPTGVATSAYQTNGGEGNPNAHWVSWEERHAEDVTPSGIALDYRNCPDEVIQRLKDLGMTKYRFSVERSIIEPTPGQFDQQALDDYREFSEKLRANGIEPLVTIHHFTDPQWFAESGGFEREENIDGLVEYAKVVVKALKDSVGSFVTMNEPAVYTFQGYILGSFPPEHKADFKTAGIVLENMMKAHIRMYEGIKEVAPDVRVGISHNVLRFHAYSSCNPIEKLIAHYLTEITHRVVMRFFQTGEFRFQFPFLANRTFDFGDKPPIDFFGVQYYTDPLLKMSCPEGMISTAYEHEFMTDYDYRFYPQGLASALEECRVLEKPVIITETGVSIPDENDRILFHKRIFQAAQEAIKEGIPLEAIYLWTDVDSWEWDRGWKLRFGLHSFDPETRAITIREVGKWLQRHLRSVEAADSYSSSSSNSSLATSSVDAE